MTDTPVHLRSMRLSVGTRGGPKGHAPLFLTDHLTLLQPGRTDNARNKYYLPLGFPGPPTAMFCAEELDSLS